MSVILTCNAGSNNTKLAAFDVKALERKGHAVLHNTSGEVTEWLCSIGTLDIAAVGHRVVHGSQQFAYPIAITDDVLDKLESYIPLAPLHQPQALKLIREARKLYPNVPHIACFDTAFHHTIPDIERRLALPRALHQEGVMRYGFHGLSYEYIASVMPQFLGEKAKGRVIVAHLGGGSSACALKNFKSVASTMGFSTLDGLMMDTRCGALDPGVVLYLLQEKKMSAAELSDMLYHKSGLKGVSGISGEMKELLKDKSLASTQAVDLYCRIAAKQIASLLPALEGLDALVFTGGIGENAAIVRESITSQLNWVGDFQTFVIPTDEELVIARAYRQMVK